MLKRFVVMFATLVSVGFFALPAGASTARPVAITTCGQMITTDAVLRQDLTCAGTAVVVAADGVTVRLDGHTLRSADGTGDGIQLGPVPNAPLAFDRAADDVTVRGGSVVGFAYGVAMLRGTSAGGAGDQLSNVHLIDNTWGVASAMTAIGVHHSEISGPNAIGPRGGPGSVSGAAEVDHSTITITQAGGYVVFSAASQPTISSSTIRGGVVDPAEGDLTLADDHLIGVTGTCGDAGLTITDSRIDGGTMAGNGPCGMTITGSRFVGPGTGTAVGGTSTFGVVLRDDVFTGWGTAVAPGNYTTLTLTDDVFRANGQAVLGCATDCYGTVTGNQFLDNRGTGIQLTEGQWTIGSNTFLRNGGLGIDAEGPSLVVTDAGGNVARHNAPPQCIGVICSSR